MKKTFAKLIFDDLTDDEYVKLTKMKRRKNNSLYKIVITSDRCDYDDLSELMEYPELGSRVGTFYFTHPNELDLILKAFEGLFYQVFNIDESERFGGGVMDYSVYEDWWDVECPCVCECCFLRGYSIPVLGDIYEHYTCKKEMK